VEEVLRKIVNRPVIARIRAGMRSGIGVAYPDPNILLEIIAVSKVEGRNSDVC
jgi:hypothetical protein